VSLLGAAWSTVYFLQTIWYWVIPCQLSKKDNIQPILSNFDEIQWFCDTFFPDKNNWIFENQTTKVTNNQSYKCLNFACICDHSSKAACQIAYRIEFEVL